MAFMDAFKSSGPPTQQSVDRRRRIAEALSRAAQVGMQGTGQGRNFRAPSTGASIASALSSIIGGYQGGKAEQEQEVVKEDRRRQIAEALAKIQGGGQNQAAMEALGALPLEQQEAALSQGVSSKLFSKPKDPIKVGAGDVLLDPETNKPIYTAPASAQKKPGEIGSLSPGDYTPESLARYQASGNFADLERAYAPTKPDAPVSAQLVTRPLPDGNVQDFAFEPRTRELSPVGEPYKDPKAKPDNSKFRAQTQISTADSVIAEIDDALGQVGFFTTGFIGNKLSEFGGTDARDLQAKLLTIKANIGFDRLQQMREASPTGGALGQVAVQELNALQSTIASLDQAQSEEQIKASLEKVKKHYENWKKAVQQANGLSDANDWENGNQPQGSELDDAMGTYLK